MENIKIFQFNIDLIWGGAFTLNAQNKTLKHNDIKCKYKNLIDVLKLFV